VVKPLKRLRQHAIVITANELELVNEYYCELLGVVLALYLEHGYAKFDSASGKAVVLGNEIPYIKDFKKDIDDVVAKCKSDKKFSIDVRKKHIGFGVRLRAVKEDAPVEAKEAWESQWKSLMSELKAKIAGKAEYSNFKVEISGTYIDCVPSGLEAQDKDQVLAKVGHL
jgi:hypothetical protein